MSIPAGAGGPIKAVIFDIGGILEPPFDHVLFPELARMLGVPEPGLRARRKADAPALTEGRMTLRDFYARVAGESASPVDPGAALARHLAVYAAATAELDQRVLGLIQELRRRYVVGCLTNTEVEVGQFNRDRGLYRPFDRAFLSTELGVGKPDQAVFRRVLADLCCAPHEVVFTDDNPVNTEGAKTAGMPAIHYRDFESFLRDLARAVERGA